MTNQWFLSYVDNWNWYHVRNQLILIKLPLLQCGIPYSFQNCMYYLHNMALFWRLKHGPCSCHGNASIQVSKGDVTSRPCNRLEVLHFANALCCDHICHLSVHCIKSAVLRSKIVTSLQHFNYDALCAKTAGKWIKECLNASPVIQHSTLCFLVKSVRYRALNKLILIKMIWMCVYIL